MNPITTSKFLAAAVIGLALTAGCASTAKHEGTGEYVDDTVITTKLKAKFVDDKTVDASNINVETFKGRVQLSGFAKNQAEADRAVQIARATEGVKEVKNDIRLK
jgi:hyperosmotically inducible protein